jgi:hypothetical protein
MWLSTETLKIVHYGLPYPRMEKVAAISKWAPAQQFLRVCTDLKKRKGVHNCSRCEKCLRTMVMLKVTGNLDEFNTFQLPFRRVDFIRWIPGITIYISQIMDFILTRKKYGFIPFLVIPALSGWIQYLVKRGIPRWLYYRLKMKAYPVWDDPFIHNHKG